jgi:hypothetical protein
MSALGTTSTASAVVVPSILSIPVSEKLTKANYPLWSAQVLPPIHATQLDDLLTGDDQQPEKELTIIIDDKPINSCNPAYSPWVTRDQAILGHLLSTLTCETLTCLVMLYINTSLVHAC